MPKESGWLSNAGAKLNSGSRGSSSAGEVSTCLPPGRRGDAVAVSKITSYGKAAFRSKKFWVSATVALSFVFGN